MLCSIALRFEGNDADGLLSEVVVKEIEGLSARVCSKDEREKSEIEE